MTMDIYQRTIRKDPSPPISVDDYSAASPLPETHAIKKMPKSTKRSFDVAFLMAPDDLSKKRDKVSLKKQYPRYSPDSKPPSPVYQINPLSLTIPPNRIKKEEDHKIENPFLIRSAFTKVANSGFQNIEMDNSPVSPVSSTTSNRSGFSPDTYQDNLSPQYSRSPLSVGGKYLPNSIIQAPGLYLMPQPVFNKSEQSKSEADYDLKMNNTRPKNGLYSPENVVPYPGFPMTAFPFPTMASAAPLPIFPAANFTAALMPSALTGFSLPAQNVCAKCNMHFRMTSDLVYHMRSHHKNENVQADPYKRRRDQDKLKCPVCNESFRERHHLTRHMTAHQDKEEDEVKLIDARSITGAK